MGIRIYTRARAGGAGIYKGGGSEKRSLNISAPNAGTGGEAELTGKSKMPLRRHSVTNVGTRGAAQTTKGHRPG